MKLFTLITLSFLLYSQLAKAENITVLNWWDYLDARIVKKAATQGFELKIQEYRSNEVALSKIAAGSKNLDVAILSNINLEAAIQAKIINTTALNSLFKERSNFYDKQIVKSNACIPYMWSSTVFSYDERVIKEKPPSSISDLYKLKLQKVKIGIIDDQYEIATRVLLDQRHVCTSKFPLNDCIGLLESTTFLNKGDFVSSIEEIVKYGNFAAYGWHGESAEHIQNFPWLNVEPAEINPVIGIDYVCILNSTKKDIKKLVKLVELLTDYESISWNMQKTQYFSPYLHHDKFLHPKIKLLQSKIRSSQNSTPVIIATPNAVSLKKLNKWWKHVRYKK